MSYLLIYFTSDINMTSPSLSWHWWAGTASAAFVASFGAVANTLACLCPCQWWTFSTYLVPVDLVSLYLMNFMFYTTLDALGNILKVHYKSMKCDVSFSQGSVSTLFRRGEHVIRVCVTMVFSLTAVQKIWKVECGPMPNVMAAQPNIGGALCLTLQSLANANYLTAVQ